MDCKSHFKWCLGYVVRAPMAGDTKKGDWSHQHLKYMLLYFEWMPQDACKHKRKPDPHHNKSSGVEMTNRAGVVFSQRISRNASHTSAVYYTHKHNKLSITKAQQWVKVHRRGHWRAALILMNWISIRQILKQVEWIKGRCRVREVRRCVFFFFKPIRRKCLWALTRHNECYQSIWLKCVCAWRGNVWRLFVFCIWTNIDFCVWVLCWCVHDT